MSQFNVTDRKNNEHDLTPLLPYLEAGWTPEMIANAVQRYINARETAKRHRQQDALAREFYKRHAGKEA